MYGSNFFTVDKTKLKIDENEFRRRLSVSKEFDVSVYEKAVCEVLSESTPKACFAKLPVFVSGNCVSFPFAKIESRDLAKNLSGCVEAFAFAVTLGHSVDRLLSKMSRLSAADFFIYDAVGSALAESVCDEAERIIKGDIECKPRFSPGYGDFSLDLQKDILRTLDAERLLGITLTDSNLMLPQKSITAVMGIRN